jgi:splicing factor 3B subunit 4
MAAGPISERNQDATIYVGGLDEKVSILACILAE